MKSVAVVVMLIVFLIPGAVSAQEQFIDYSQVSLLRWIGPDQPDTYAEYIATHPPQPIQIVPLRMAPLRMALDENPPRVLVIVNGALLPLIQTKVDRYVSDIEAEGYAVDLYSSTVGTAESLKAFIISQSTDLAGCVLFGNLPCAWYEIEDDFNEYGYASFPCDLYLTDLDGTWEDLETTAPMQSGVYDTHTNGSGDTAPEIFLGRIDAYRMTGDAEYVQINEYLDKLHSWYSAELPMTNYALTYTEDDWSESPAFWTDIEYAFPDNEAIKAPSTDRDDYRDNRLTSPLYEFIQLSCHSNPGAHYFTRGGELTSSAIKAIPPQAPFYNLFCCSASRYTSSDFLGGAYIFNPSTTALATVGSTKTGSMLNFWAFYQPLGERNSIGQALNDWFNTIAPYSFLEICWHYGMTIMGDPLLVPVSGGPSSIVLVQPNGGEILKVGEEYEIKWWMLNVEPDSISILLSVDGGGTYPDTVVTGLPGSNTTYVWTVPNLYVLTARLKVVTYNADTISAYDQSDADFVISGLPTTRKYVSSAGSNTYPYSLPQWAAHMIQDAVDAAENGDSVMVATGIYAENVGVVSPLYLLGGWNSDFTSWDPETYPTTINVAGSPVSFFTIPSGYCGIEGFIITGGTGSQLFMPNLGNYGGGVVSKDADPIIKNNKFTSCGYVAPTTFSGGGAIACTGGAVKISGNIITESLAQSGGGIYLYDVTGTVSGNRVTGSAPHAGYGGYKYGGGIYCLHSTLNLASNVITGNNGYSNGGGVYARLSSLTLNGDSIRTNDCTMSGGGIYTDHSSLTLSRCAVLENHAPTMGGGIYHKAAYLKIKNTLIAENDCDALGGGLCADSTWGEITNNTIDRNYAQYVGGNLYLSLAVSMDVRNNLITYARQANGVQAASPDNITFQYNNCYGNQAQDVVTITPDSTNSSRHPHYADTTSQDYHLGLHSGGIDTGDPMIIDPDGARSNQGLYGGPAAATSAPAYVQGFSATALNDTTIGLSWDPREMGDYDYYAIYCDTTDGFIPADSNYLDMTPYTAITYQHHPVSGCFYYRVCLVNDMGYAGGYSEQDSACVSGGTTGVDDTPRFVNRLEQNYPNPFNPVTKIGFDLRRAGHVNLSVYNVKGQLITILVDGYMPNGHKEVTWIAKDNNGRPISSGIYFYRLIAGDFVQTRKMVLLR